MVGQDVPIFAKSNNAAGAVAMSKDPLQPGMAVLVKLGSIAVHADEYLSPDGCGVDANVIKGLLADIEIVVWLGKMQEKGLLPEKRNG